MKTRCKHGAVTEMHETLTACFVLFASLLAVVGCTTPPISSASDTQVASPTSSVAPTNVEEARAIAIAAFEKATKNQIANYSVEVVEIDSNVWQFLVKGEGDYARPGFHWLVNVSRQDGSVTIVPGE